MNNFILKQNDSDGWVESEFVQSHGPDDSDGNRVTKQTLQASTLSKGYFQAQDKNDELFSPQQQSPIKLNRGNKKSQQVDAQVDSPSKSKRKRQNREKLKPLVDVKQVQVFKNVANNDKYQSRKTGRRSKGHEERLDNLDGDKIKKDKHEIQFGSLEQDQTGRTLNEGDQEKKKEEGCLKKGSTDLSQHNIDSNLSEKSDISQGAEEQKSMDNENEQNFDEDSPQKLAGNKKASPDHQMKGLLKTVQKNSVMKMVVEKSSNGWFLDLWPQYNVFLEDQKRFIMSGKKVSRTPYSTFVFSQQKSQFEENSDSYLGKAKSSVMGDQLDIYGPGLNPNNAFDKKVKPRQVVATVTYETRYLQIGQPRDFKVYLKKPEYDYYSDFPQIKEYQQEISLNLLYQNPQNQKKIMVLRNRNPEYKEYIKGYMLNFKGRVTMASVKNFILEEQGKPNEDIMIFGKYQDKKYHMDVAAPLTPSIAFGIILSSFDSKFFCE